ncbi:unnamed protein product [Laminaria digitata]
MTEKTSDITFETPANVALNAILADKTKYPCLASMLYHLAESLQGKSDELALKCLSQVNDITWGRTNSEQARSFAYDHGAGYSAEAQAFYKALIYLIEQDEGYRAAYLDMSPRARRSFVMRRISIAREMSVEYGIAL